MIIINLEETKQLCVGEEFSWQDTLFQIREKEFFGNCSMCHFRIHNSNSCCWSYPICNRFNRIDNKEVYYVKLKIC